MTTSQDVERGSALSEPPHSVDIMYALCMRFRHVDAFSKCGLSKKMTKSVFGVPIVVIMLTFRGDRRIKPS